MRCSASRVILAAFLATTACGRDDATPKHAVGESGRIDLTGSGGTFAYPVFARWFGGHAASTGVHINYRSVGSAAGMHQLAAGTADFAATEAPASGTELERLSALDVLQLPVVVGGIAVVYHLPDLQAPLRLTGTLLADMYLGAITRWNDRRVRAVNPGVSLPARPITVVTRLDGSGTTFVLATYLSQVSQSWASTIGIGRTLRWPVGTGAQGSEGVAGHVKQTPYSLGAVELAYALQNRLAVAALQNRRGAFVLPSAATVAAAAEQAQLALPHIDDPHVTVVSLVNGDGEAAYPVSSYTWLLIARRSASPERQRKLLQFVRWAIREGGADATSLGYAPLPGAVARRVERSLDSLEGAPHR